MNDKNILVVGYGIVGKLEYKLLEKLEPHIYDKYNTEVNTKSDIHYDLAIVAVPTPTIDGRCDVSAVWDAVKENEADVYLIKSTVTVGTCDAIAAATGKRIVHSPEHSGATQHCNNFDYNFTILGGDKADCQFVQQIYQRVYDARHIFKFVDRKTSELSKYMLNSFLATKVSFCVSFWEICQQLGLSYEELRECFVLDSRIGRPHTFVYDDAPYWDSHCFNKDLPAIANQFDVPLLKSVVEYNDKMKDEHNGKTR